MAKKKIETLRDIFDLAGSSTQLAAKLNLHAFSVENWRRNGVPFKYWEPLIKMLGITPTDLHVVGKACREHTYGEKE
jgi:hypothetical protein